MPSWKDHSRTAWQEGGGSESQSTKFPGCDQVKIGAIQRIADAVETIAKDRVSMEADLKWYKELNERNNATIARLRKSNAALRGCLRRAKNNAVRP